MSGLARRQSPEYVQMSLAAAMVLGLRPGRFMRDGRTRCLNLLLTYDAGCAANCAYCGLARDRQGSSFIRVEWPSVPMAEVIERSKGRPLERMCISMITHRRAQRDTEALLTSWKREDALREVPVSILSNPSTMSREDLVALRELGAERFTVALDAVTPELFDSTRGRGVLSPNRWERYWQVYEEAVEVFGRGAVGVHLICGLGETEGQMVETMFRARALGEYGCLQLFAFNPEDGSRLGDRQRVPLGQFRRVQLARYLIDAGLVRDGDLDTDDRGRIVDFGLDQAELDRLIDTGLPFRTSGCPGRECEVSACNRPFGDGPPTDFSSFPFPLDRWDVDNVRVQLRDYEGAIRREDLAARTLAEIERASALPCRS
ncbi:MAG TPA: radical SAM protein [Myxococcota bacterium]|nr:radical SAM protein [Myxococcota bacterium]